jgi:hypothetical protein
MIDMVFAVQVEQLPPYAKDYRVASSIMDLLRGDLRRQYGDQVQIKVGFVKPEDRKEGV